MVHIMKMRSLLYVAYTQRQLITYNQITEKPIKLLEHKQHFRFFILGIELWNEWEKGFVEHECFSPVIEDILIHPVVGRYYTIHCNTIKTTSLNVFSSYTTHTYRILWLS